MITRLLVLGVIGFLSSTVMASDDISNASSTVSNDDQLMVANPRKERRDDRQGDRHENRDDKQDCRHEEGLAGHDKRECKQENRGEDDDDEKDDDADA